MLPAQARPPSSGLLQCGPTGTPLSPQTAQPPHLHHLKWPPQPSEPAAGAPGTEHQAHGTGHRAQHRAQRSTSHPIHTQSTARHLLQRQQGAGHLRTTQPWVGSFQGGARGKEAAARAWEGGVSRAVTAGLQEGTPPLLLSRGEGSPRPRCRPPAPTHSRRHPQTVSPRLQAASPAGGGKGGGSPLSYRQALQVSQKNLCS